MDEQSQLELYLRRRIRLQDKAAGHSVLEIASEVDRQIIDIDSKLSSAIAAAYNDCTNDLGRLFSILMIEVPGNEIKNKSEETQTETGE